MNQVVKPRKCRKSWFFQSVMDASTCLDLLLKTPRISFFSPPPPTADCTLIRGPTYRLYSTQVNFITGICKQTDRRKFSMKSIPAGQSGQTDLTCFWKVFLFFKETLREVYFLFFGCWRLFKRDSHLFATRLTIRNKTKKDYIFI